MQTEIKTLEKTAVAPQERLSLATKLSYACGAVSDVLMANIIFQLSGPIYVEALNVSPVLIGLAVSIPRLWDAITDPIMGNISDNSRLRWGRRRPFMFVGALLAAIFCVALWIPPISLGSGGLFVYFLVISIFFFTAYTVYSIPFNALGFELSTDYDERTTIMSYKTFMMNMGTTLVLPWAYKMCRLDIFGGDEVVGVRYVGAMFAAMIFGAAIVTVLLCRERPGVQTQAKIRFLDAIKYTISNKTFLGLNGIVLGTLCGAFMAFPLLFYLNLSYICGDKDLTATWTGWYGMVYGAGGMLFVPLINYLGQKLGKKQTLLLGLSSIILAFAASWWLFTPKYPWLQLIFALLASPSMSCVFVLTSSMMADVCDLDELQTGLRREGMYGAVFGFMVKLSLAGVLALSGFILAWAGYNTELDAQTPETIRNMRVFFVFLPMALLVIAWLLAARFPLTKQRMQEVRAELDQRKTQTL